MQLELEYNGETGEWEVSVDGGIYSFTEETEALQFINLQATFLNDEEEEEIETR